MIKMKTGKPKSYLDRHVGYCTQLSIKGLIRALKLRANQANLSS